MMFHDIFKIPIIVGSVFLLIGMITLRFPPRRINFFYGYRTPRSMKDQERWDFAQKYSATDCIRLGGILLLISAMGILLQVNERFSAFIAHASVIMVPFLLIFRVERALKRKFSKER